MEKIKKSLLKIKFYPIGNIESELARLFSEKLSSFNKIFWRGNMAQTNILLESGTNELEIVEFYIEEINEDGEEYRGYYGINVAKVVEIIRKQPLTQIPSEEVKGMAGMFPFRNGKVIPLIDLASFLNKKSKKNSDPKVIVTEFNNTLTSFLVSGVNRIYRLSWTDVELPSKLIQHSCGDCITSVVRIENRVVLVLDLEAIVASMTPELAMQEYELEALPDGQKYETYHIIHVDDSRSIRRMVMDILSKDTRFKVQQFEDGLQAFNYIKERQQEAFDKNVPVTNFIQGIIADVEMPNMDGLSLCKEVKSDNTLRNIPVAIFSSLISPDTAHKANSVGADAQFAKPELKVLADKIYELIQNQAKKPQVTPQEAVVAQ